MGGGDEGNPPLFAEAAAQKGGNPLDPDRPVLSYVSRMDEDRALVARQLIAIAPELDRAVPGIQLLIAGGGNVLDERRIGNPPPFDAPSSAQRLPAVHRPPAAPSPPEAGGRRRSHRPAVVLAWTQACPGSRSCPPGPRPACRGQKGHESIQQAIRAASDDVSVTVLSNDPEQTHRQYGLEARLHQKKEHLQGVLPAQMVTQPCQLGIEVAHVLPVPDRHRHEDWANQ